MSEKHRQRPKLQIAQLLDMLREHAQHTDAEAHLHEPGDFSVVRRISDEVAFLTGASDIRPGVDVLMQAIRKRVVNIKTDVAFRAVGTVQHIGNGVARLSGLPNSTTDELVTFPTGVQGMILNLEHQYLDVILLGASEGIQGGDLVTATGERLRVPVGQQLLGRVVNPLGKPLDGMGMVDAVGHWHLEFDAPGIVARAPINVPLLTGWKMVDALVPIGRGQRELIIGDRQTGKTTLAVDAILNQKDSGVMCVYVAVGQKKSSTLAMIETLRRAKAIEYTTVVVSSPDDPPALRYLAPYAGCTMAEWLMEQGRDVLIVYDDLSKHADAYRELSLLLRRPPGREAYPGDIFYLHSRLLERACRLNEGAGGGSITALPVVETQRGNLSAYIPTNLISITDGQILLDSDMFNRGIKPAVDAGRSVSRVGGAAQYPAMRNASANLRLELAQYEEVARFARFGTEVDEATQQQIRRGERLRRLLTQPAHRPMALASQVLVLWTAAHGYLDEIPIEEISAFEHGLIAHMQVVHPMLFQRAEHLDKALEENRELLVETIEHFCQDWARQHNRP